jgi:hypothetical protein
MGERDKEEDIDLEMDETEKEEDLDRLKFMLEQQRLALERDKWQADLELRRRELCCGQVITDTELSNFR